MVRRLRLETCINTRDIGGYVGYDGKATRFREFLRSDDVSMCKDYERKALMDYGLRTVIDLRGQDELQAFPSRFALDKDIKYYSIPIIPERISVYNEIRMADLYIDIVENKEAICQLFKAIAESCDGIVLYHCTAGKDRTGVTTCLLLMLAAVDEYDIAADYEVTYTYLEPKRILLKKEFPNMPQHVLQSNPQWIRRLYKYIKEKYSSAEEYLQMTGVTKEELGKIKNKLIGD